MNMSGPSPLLPTSALSAATLICFSHLRWNFVYQRPQHLMARAAKSYRVIYFEEPLFMDIGFPVLHQTPTPEGVLVVTPHLPAGLSPAHQNTALRMLLDGLRPDQSEAFIAWYYTPLALDFSRHLQPALCVYDNMDELAAFRGASPGLLAAETELLARADLVFTGGYSLFESKRTRHANIHAFPSSIDRAHFARPAGALADAPADLAAIGRPRIGFFGVIDERMDLDLVAGIARARPEWNLVMIGPVVKIDPLDLPTIPNIHWLGSKPYAALPSYLHHFDVGFMPFAINEATRFISPTKTPEFLASGLPVVSTPIADVVRPYGTAGLVQIAGDPAECVAAIERALRPPEKDWIEAVDRYLSTTSWDLTWNDMLSLMEDAPYLPMAKQSKASSHRASHGGAFV